MAGFVRLAGRPPGRSGWLDHYAYAYNDPVNLIDPDGTVPWLAVAGGALPGGASGFAQGFLFDAAFQLARNGGHFDCVDWGGAATVGALTGAAYALSGGIGTAAILTRGGLHTPALSKAEVAGLRQLFGKSTGGAESLLGRLHAGERVPLPHGVTPQSLKTYRQIAERAIGQGKDTLGVQAKRKEALELLLKQGK